MISFNFIKFLGVCAFALAISSACRFWQKGVGETPAPTPFVAEELKSEIPFSTREPENFQVEIVITAGGAENKIFTARSGNSRRFDYDSGAKNQVSFLQTDKNYLMLPGKKIYTENVPDGFAASENWTDFLTVEWLNAKTDVKFSSEGKENNLAKYRAVFGEAENAKSESLIFIDENANLPVRQEFYSVSGEQKTLTMTVELKNLKFEAEAELFAVPKDYKKVSNEEFRSVLKKENE
jgi:outer membrane lipoprotein-sorting protein